MLTIASEKAADGKSYVNPPAEKKSEAYSSFVSPITNGSRGGFEYADYTARLRNGLTLAQHTHLLLTVRARRAKIRNRALGAHTARVYVAHSPLSCLLQGLAPLTHNISP